ncbi:Cysteine-rich DPF motif domain-containing protein 1 [Lonchura striata]|uniref:Cysteine-rich DPF motif domain-containing protein 1 n=1 Tax=Lonchura striata TaxID=40157 RepID=A0A218UPS4_9PASE|nr:Cysteine-rich DPF motif domain-containing protein 1 [Lonchura striata domestica]
MDAPKEVQIPGEFRCELCELSAPYTYYGWMSPNSHLISEITDFISAMDIRILIDCCLFYSKSFCLPSMKENLQAFPFEIQDMDRRKPQQKSCKKMDTKHKS